MKLLSVILSVACVVLATLLFLRDRDRDTITKQLTSTTDEVDALSGEFRETRGKLDEESRLSSILQSNLNQRVADLKIVSNSLIKATGSLAAVRVQLATVRRESEARASRVTKLEAEKDEMQTQLEELAGSIRTLNEQIASTKGDLAEALGDRESLASELTRLQADRAELLRQFNDLAALRAQVALLRGENVVNRRLSWKAQGVYRAANRKGAAALIAKPRAPRQPINPSLNVELDQDGGARIKPPSVD